MPSAQGGQLRLSMRTARGPAPWWFSTGGRGPEKDVEYFEALAGKEDEINLWPQLPSSALVRNGPEEAREFVAQSGIKSYVLYDYAKVASREWGTCYKKTRNTASIPGRRSL